MLEVFIRKCPEALTIRNTSGLTPFHILASNKAMTEGIFESWVLPLFP
jgi:hypothetical protein